MVVASHLAQIQRRALLLQSRSAWLALHFNTSNIVDAVMDGKYHVDVPYELQVSDFGLSRSADSTVHTDHFGTVRRCHQK
jgi:hypothetical protein